MYIIENFSQEFSFHFPNIVIEHASDISMATPFSHTCALAKLLGGEKFKMLVLGEDTRLQGQIYVCEPDRRGSMPIENPFDRSPHSPSRHKCLFLPELTHEFTDSHFIFVGAKWWSSNLMILFITPPAFLNKHLSIVTKVSLRTESLHVLR